LPRLDIEAHTIRHARTSLPPRGDRSAAGCLGPAAVTLSAARGAARGTGFEKLLAVLDADRERAGHRYEAIRRQLIKLFECRGGRRPDELADETIDRVARKLDAGEEIRGGDIGAYFYGVGRNVLRESWRRPVDEPLRGPLADVRTTEAGAAPDGLGERRLACLEHCVEGLPAEERNLILWYYQIGERILIEPRKRLAASLGISLNALRIRAHRVRGRLEACVRACVETPPAEPEMVSDGRPRQGDGADR
jgi:DNA-directed RNA polymerase specialized sigma24 family protein